MISYRMQEELRRYAEQHKDELLEDDDGPSMEFGALCVVLGTVAVLLVGYYVWGW